MYKKQSSQLSESGSFSGEENRQAYLRSNLDAIYGVAKNCCICNKKFGFLNGETLCMRCNRAACKNCIVEKINIVYVKSGKIESGKQKVCKNCDQDMKSHNAVSSESKGFGTDTKVSIRWLKALGVINKNLGEQEERKKLEEFAQSYKNVQEVTIVNAKDVKYKEFIIAKMNFSYLQHVHVQLGESKNRFDEVQISISRLINKLAGHYAWKKLPMKVDILGLFLLTFASEPTAFIVLTHLLDHLLPPYIQQSLFLNSRYSQALSWQQKSNQFVEALAHITKDLTKEKKKEVLIFLEKFGLDMLSSLFINILNLQCFFYALDYLILSKKFDHLENILVWIMMDNFNLMKDLSSDSHEKAYGFFARTVEIGTLQSLGDLIQAHKNFTAETKKEDPAESSRVRAASKAFNPMIDNGNKQFFTAEDHKKIIPSNVPQQNQVSAHPNVQSNQAQTSSTQHHQSNHTQQESPKLNQSQENQRPNIHIESTDVEEEEHVKRAHRPNKAAEQEIEKHEAHQSSSSHQSHPPQPTKVEPCTSCPEKDDRLTQLSAENDRIQRELEGLHSKLITQTNQLSQQISQISIDQEKLIRLEAEISELKNQQRPNELLNKYKQLLHTQKEMLEKISKEKETMEVKFIEERESAIVSSIKDKMILQDEIAAVEKQRAQEESLAIKTAESLNEKLKNLGEKNAKLLEELNSEKVALALIQKQKQSITEQLVSAKRDHEAEIERTALAEDVSKESIRELRESIERLQNDLTEHAAQRQKATEQSTEQNLIVYDELREQINCLELKIKELEESLKQALQKHVDDHEKHSSETAALRQEIEAQRNQFEEQAKLVENENRIQQSHLNEQIEKAIVEGKQTAEVILSEKNSHIEGLDKEIDSLKEKNGHLTSQNESLAIKVLEQSDEISQKQEAIDKNHEKIEEISKEHKQLKDQHAELQSQLNETKEELSNTKEQLEERSNTVVARDEQLTSEKEQSDQKEKALQGELANVKEELAAKVIEKDDRDAEIERLKALLEKTNKEKAAVTAELNKYQSIFNSVRQTVNEAATD